MSDETAPTLLRFPPADVQKDALARLDPGLLRNAIEATRDGVTITDALAPGMPLVYVNPAFVRMTGYTHADCIGRNCRFLQGPDTGQPGLAHLREAIEKGTSCLVTLRNYRKDGSLFHNELSLSPIHAADGTVTHYIGIQKDVTHKVEQSAQLRERELALKYANHQLERAASTDSLTGIHNRRMMEIALEREWRRALRFKHRIAGYMIDIDYFKRLNDLHGHQIGDECLRRFGIGLRKVFARATDYVGRYGGDEFVVLCTDLKASEALTHGERLLEMARSLPMPDGVDPITVSVGVCSLVVSQEMNEQLFLAAADTALYKAKRGGRNRVELVGDERSGGAPMPD